MAKLVFFAVFLAALVAVSIAGVEDTQNYNPFRPSGRAMQCQREIKESSLDACRQIMELQLAGAQPMLQPWVDSRKGRIGVARKGSEGTRMQCCQQLQDISRECRCAAIRRMVSEYEKTMLPPLGGEGHYPGEPTAAEEQEGSGFYPSYPCQQPEGPQQYYPYPEPEGQPQHYPSYPAGQPEGPQYYPSCYPGGCDEEEKYQGAYSAGLQMTARVKLTKARQYAARLPAMCRLEPQECRVFSAQPY